MVTNVRKSKSLSRDGLVLSGLAAVVLLDESHVSAHCYYGKGLLAIDAFTCGGSDPNLIIDIIHHKLSSEMKDIRQVSRNEINRFKN